MSVRVTFEGVPELQRDLEKLDKRLASRSFKSTANFIARQVVKSARQELGKSGSFPDMHTVWKALGTKRLRDRSGSIGVMAYVRKDSKFDGDRLTVAGLAKLIQKGNYKTPGRKGRGDVTQYAKGDYVAKGWNNIKGAAGRLFERKFEENVEKRL